MTFNLAKSFLICIASSLSLASCGQSVPQKLIADVTVTKANAPGRSFDSLQITVFFNRYPLLKKSENEVVEFYKERNFQYAWYNKGLLIEQAGNLASRILNFKSDGLGRSSPYQHVLDSLLNQIKPNGKGIGPDLQLEIMLTAQYFHFSKAVYQGADLAASRASGWLLPRKKVTYGPYLDSLLSAPDKQLSLKEPVYRQYELLRSFLKKYYRLQVEDAWLPLILTKRIVP
jgi:hypothetical protein